MKKILQHLLHHKSLSQQEAYNVMIAIANGVYNDTELAAFVTVYLMRSITIQELQGFRTALLEKSIPITFEEQNVTDIVGTGGDGKQTFNISTLSAFVVAGAGYKVAKHGNYGVSTVSGSSNVMEQLGYQFTNNSATLQQQLTQANITFLHAPLFHPALKVVANTRRNIGIRTFFNLLGPLVNPAQPKYAILGVYSLEIARYYTYLLQQQPTNFAIVHTLDGYDEISLTDDTKITTNTKEEIFSPEYLGKRTVKQQDLYGGNTVEEAATIFLQILNGKGTWAHNAVVMANAAIAIQNMDATLLYPAAYSKAVESLESGKALQQFNTLISLQ